MPKAQSSILMYFYYMVSYNKTSRHTLKYYCEVVGIEIEFFRLMHGIRTKKRWHLNKKCHHNLKTICFPPSTANMVLKLEILSRQPHIMSIRICETFATTVGVELIQRKYFTIFVNDIPLCYRIESQ
jgi:hypothetical protein